MRRSRLFPALLLLLLLSSCRKSSGQRFTAEVLPLPSPQPPMLSVHIVSDNAVERMDIETYLLGVVAGEMPNH